MRAVRAVARGDVSVALEQLDPGPMARLEDVIARPDTLSIIVQRITDADAPETLKQIARAWKVPHGKLAEWITADRERAERYANALKVAGEAAAHDVIPIADGATPEDVAVRKLQIDARKWYAGKLSRERFGESTEVKHTGSVSLVTILSSMPRGEVIDVTPEPEPPEPVALEAPKQSSEDTSNEGII